MDLSFLFEPNGIEDFVEDLFAFNVIVFESEDPLPKIVRLNCHSIGLDDVVDMVVSNGKEDESAPWFRLIMRKYTETNTINRGLESFFLATGILGVHARCDYAIVMAMMNKDFPDSCVDVPSYYYKQDAPISPVDTLTRVEITNRLESIPGECQRLIFRFLQHPVACILQQHWQWHRNYWDRHFNHLASSFNRDQPWSSFAFTPP